MKNIKRFEKAKETILHRKEVQRIAHSLGYSFPFHDLLKLINIILLGDDIATKLHRRFSKHHLHNKDIKNKIEAAIDWESARFTKPSKPLDAYDTWKKYYSDIDMEETLKLLGFWKEVK
ncbi:MAG: hypothetical protein HUJ68_09805 [Clostridia bacterium]|nr:hypothetical protein [Clostridia bacterium]